MRKIMIIGIVLLFLGVSGVPGYRLDSNPQPLTRGWLYVGGSGPGNYTTIQSAINAANPGDTVFVYSGLYLENVLVDKPLEIRGEDPQTTIIDGGSSGDAVKITLDSVDLHTFTIRHGYNGIVLENTHDCSITGNQIYQTSSFGSGILLESSHHNTILNNTIRECSGIYLETSDNNSIQLNHHTLNNFYSLLISASHGNRIEHNTYENTRWSGIGQVILISGAMYNIVRNNCLINDSFFVSDAEQNQILNNTVNGKALVYLERSSGDIIDYPAGQVILLYSENVKVQNQTDIAIHVLGCKHCWFENITSRTNLSAGFYIWNSTDITITNCRISQCIYGIEIWHSSQLTIQNTRFWKNSYVAIYMLNGSDIDIAHNSFEENGGLVHPSPGAIRIDSSTPIRVQWNNFIGNRNGIYFSNCQRKAILWDANYWDKPRVLPKVIVGRTLFRLFQVNFDWHPAQEPYDIS